MSKEKEPGQVIVVTSGKGGVGKTTTSANIGSALALNEKSVVIVDGDIGLRNLDVVMGLENRIVYDIVDIVEGRCRLEQALIKDKRFTNLSILPAAQTRDKSAVSPEQMVDISNELKKTFDYVFIDCPAGIEQGFKNSIAGADKAIVVTTPEVSAVRDADRVIGLLNAADVKETKLVVNRVRPAMIQRGDMMDIGDVVDILAVDLLGIIPDDESVITTTNKGEPVVLGDSLAGQAYRNIAGRLQGISIPILTLEQNVSFLDKIKNIFKAKKENTK